MGTELVKIRRKWCRLHGWAPHQTWTGKSGIKYRSCCRCAGAEGYTRGEKIKAFLRGFRLPKSVRAREFVNNRF